MFPNKVIARVIKYVNSNTDECLLYPFRNMDGYGDIQYNETVNGTYKHHHLLAHRVVFMLYNKDKITSDILVCHSCDVPDCCNPRHLFKGSHNDNVQDKVNKGRQAKGVNNGRYTNGYNAKYDYVEKPKTPFEKLKGRSLTIDQVILIKKEIAKGKYKTVKELSFKIGIKHQTVKDIYYGRSYQSITI